MIYHLLWRKGAGWGSGTVHTWDEKVRATTPALNHLVGRSFYAVAMAAEDLGAQVIVEPDRGNSRVVMRRLGEFGGVTW